MPYHRTLGGIIPLCLRKGHLIGCRPVSADSPFRLRHLGAFVRHRQLKDRGLLALFQQRQQDDLAIRKFQRVVMNRRIILIDLTVPSFP